ncbi:MAG: type II CAAX endopeptidase family protein [Anaerolineales bacterium]|jgi:membrane protease YdiL (CAAX protease family)
MNEKSILTGKISVGNPIQRLALAKPILVCVVLFIIATSFRWIDSFVLRLDERIGELILTKSLGFALVLAFVWVTGQKIKDIGLHSKFLRQSLLIGTLTSVVAYFFGYGVEVLLALQSGTQPKFQFGAIDPKIGVSGGILFALFLLVGNMINSFMEDGLFRGVMGRLARVRFGFWKTNWFQAFMFGIWHLPWVMKYYLLGEINTSGELFTQIAFNSLPQLLIGVVYGYMYLKTNSLWAPWLAHTISNSASNFVHVTTTEGMDPGLPVRMSVYLVVMLVSLIWVRRVTQKHQIPEVKPWGVED